MNGHGTERGDLLTLSEVADALKLKISTLRAWVLRRRIPYVKLGRLVRVRRADVEALIASNVVPAAHVEKRGGAATPRWNATNLCTPLERQVAALKTDRNRQR